jgi:hypothetical protein
LQNWHLYFFSGAAPDAFRVAAGDELADMTVMAAATGITITAAIDDGEG